MRNDDNKNELFAFLADECTKIAVEDGKLVISTNGTDIMDTGEVQNRNSIAPCSHEEADTRLILHAAHVGKSEMKKVMIKTVDTDVVVLAISFFSECSLDELWVEFGSGKYHRYISIHVLHKAFTKEQAQALRFSCIYRM